MSGRHELIEIAKLKFIFPTFRTLLFVPLTRAISGGIVFYSEEFGATNYVSQQIY